jgi:hypothetical protein
MLLAYPRKPKEREPYNTAGSIHSLIFPRLVTEQELAPYYRHTGPVQVAKTSSGLSLSLSG